MSKVQFVYVIEMLRDGDRESHSYVAGIFNDRKLAIYEAKLHILMGSGKYTAVVSEELVDSVGGVGVVCRICDVIDDEDELENAVKSRKEWLAYRDKIRGEFAG